MARRLTVVNKLARFTLTHSQDEKTWTYVTEPVHSKSLEAPRDRGTDLQCLTKRESSVLKARLSNVRHTTNKELIDTSLLPPNENVSQIRKACSNDSHHSIANIQTAESQAVMALFEYLRELPSKSIEVPTDALAPIVSIISDIHNVSLMLDDVEDNSPLRRTKPATHSVFGIPQTVNSATYQIVDIISRTVQLNNTGSLNAVTNHVYKPKEQYDILSHECSTRKPKGFCEDLDERKWGFIIIHAYHNAQSMMKKAFDSMLMQRRAARMASVGHKEMIVKWLQQGGAVDCTANASRMLQHELMGELDAIERERGSVTR
ncbi:isoprenoid synthase domain-containing protein [Xylaria longipes]|nr:isoprenoid synthase domain-containing protein [Xylaria longipes]